MSTSLLSLLHDLVGNGHRAGRYAVMNPPSRDAKYTTVDQALTDAQLDEHLLGEHTYAAYIIGADGLVSGACIELDQDALVGAGRVLESTLKFSVSAFSIAVPGAGTHDGSHTWILFDQRVTPAAAAHLARQIAADAGYPDAEIRPTGAAIRLPFGIHTHSRKRGRLILPSGEVYDLDDSDQLSMGAACVAALPKNAAPPEPPKVEPRPIKSVQVRTLTCGPSPIAQFNAAHKSEDLIEHYGGRRTRDGWACNCGVQHSHTTQLQVLSDGGIVSYSPNCRWAPHYTSGKCTDAFGLYCLVEHSGDRKAAVKALLPASEPPAKIINFNNIQVDCAPAKPSIDQAAAYNAARREKRHQETREALDAIYGIADSVDFTRAVPTGTSPEAHDERTRLLFVYLLTTCYDRGVLQVAPTNEQLSSDLDMCERYVQYAFRELEAAGIGKRQGGRGGLGQPNKAATWTFYRLPHLGCKPQQDAICTLVIDIRDPNTEILDTCERGGIPLGEPDSPDTWAWREDDHGAAELNALDTAPPSQALEPEMLHGATFTPRVVRSAGRWRAFDGQCYTWHTTRAAAELAAGMAPAELSVLANLQKPIKVGETDISESLPKSQKVDPDDTPGASYVGPDAPLPPADPRAVPSWLRTAGDVAMERRADDAGELLDQADLFVPAPAPGVPFIRPARAAQILEMPAALRGWAPKHAAQARKARDALAALASPPLTSQTHVGVERAAVGNLQRA